MVTGNMARILREEEDASKVTALGCDVCCAEGDSTMLYGYVGKNTKLCMTGWNCFGWFSGYPWVLFKDGCLVSDLRTGSLEADTLEGYYDVPL